MGDGFNFAIASLDGYSEKFSALADFLGSEWKVPPAGEIEFLARVTDRKFGYGAIGITDTLFLTAITSVLAPRNALEIGTASGFSTAILAAALARGFESRGEAMPPTLIHSIDRKDRCISDTTKATGFHIGEIVPEFEERVELHTLKDSSDAPAIFARGELEHAFIDGSHQHPWPLIDALELLPLMKGGRWMVLHDIDLPNVAQRVRQAGGTPFEARYGAQYLFDAWPGRKIDGGNIGAIEVPKDFRFVKKMAGELLSKPFETSESGWKRYRAKVETLTRELS